MNMRTYFMNYIKMILIYLFIRALKEVYVVNQPIEFDEALCVSLMEKN